MSDGPQTVGDLDPKQTIYYTSHTGGPERPAHLDPDCRHLDRGDQCFDSLAEAQHPDRDICRECAGIAEFGAESGTNVNETRERLSDLDPDDIGLSPLGERGGESA